MNGRFREALQRVRAFAIKQRLEEELEAEVASFLDCATEENIGRGMPPAEARRQALISFGGVEQAKEKQREIRGVLVLDALLQDLRLSARLLIRDRSFTTTALLILTLGVGINAAVFSLVNTIFFRPLPLNESQQLVQMSDLKGKSGLSTQTYSVDAYEEFQRLNHTFTAVTSYFPFSPAENFRLTGQGDAVSLSALPVADNFFQTLGVTPMLGRLFTPHEGAEGTRPSALLGYALWKRQFHQNPGIIGQVITLNGESFYVAGILPRSFDFSSIFSPGRPIDIFVPWETIHGIRGYFNTLSLIGRLKPGVSLSQAQAEANLIFPQLQPSYQVDLVGLKDFVTGRLNRYLIMLWAASGFIMMIMLLNLWILQQTRSASRTKEFAVHSALGAGRSRLARQILAESIMLFAVGSTLGLCIAWGTTWYIARQGSIAVPLLSGVKIDGAVLTWTASTSLIAAFLLVAPRMASISEESLQTDLHAYGSGLRGENRSDLMRTILLVSEVALACVLLVGGGLFLHSFMKVIDRDLGFSPKQATAVKVDFDGAASIKLDSQGNDLARLSNDVFQEVVKRIEGIPGVQSAGASDALPLERSRSWGIRAKDRPDEKEQIAHVLLVTPGYLQTIDVRLVNGRELNWSDTSGQEKVVILNETAAHQLWPGMDPIGRLAVIAGEDVRVIGVVADVVEQNIEGDAGLQMYLPYGQYGGISVQLVVRSELPVKELRSDVMRALRAANAGQPATAFHPLKQLVDRATSQRRFFTAFIVAFAVLGLVLASLGVYGAISSLVRQQARGIGIRLAFGATRRRVKIEVLSNILRMALLGIMVGTLGSSVMGSAIASLLYDTKPTDIGIFTIVTILLTAVAFLAAYIPAQRISRIDPMTAIRSN